MTLTALCIQTEAYVQEEIDAQRRVLDALARTEASARSGQGPALARSADELAALVAEVGARSTRRRALLGKLAAALSVPANAVTLSRLSERLVQEQLEVGRLSALREELRTVVAAVVKTSRKLAAMAKVHHGLLEELCALASGSGTNGTGSVVDARG